MQRSTKPIIKYLERQSDPLAADIVAALSDFAPVDHAVVIPAFMEGSDFIKRFCQQFKHQNVLCILVLNGPSDMTSAQQALTLEAKNWLLNHCNLIKHTGPFDLWTCYDLQVLSIDLVSQPIPKHGVGAARKLGTDLCLWLYVHQVLKTPWVHTTDADVICPDNYFEARSFKHDTAVALFPFQHQLLETDSPNHQLATLIYDSWLRYYTLALRWAGSSWAFPTIGSTFLIHLHYYAQCHGFPQKEAGEDFYLLNKLAKLGTVTQLRSPTLILSNRYSKRTPFGTGSSIDQIAHQQSNWNFYHPNIFALLKLWYKHRHMLFDTTDIVEFPPPLQAVLHALKIPQHLSHCRRQSKNLAGFLKHLDQHFDAFLTLKFIHWLRKHYYSSVTYPQLLTLINESEVPFIAPGIKDITHLNQWLIAKDGISST